MPRSSEEASPLAGPNGSMPSPFDAVLPSARRREEEEAAAAVAAAAGGAAPATDTAGREHPAAAAAAVAGGEASIEEGDENLGEEGSGPLMGYGTLSQDMEEVARRAEEAPPAAPPPPSTLRLDELPPLSSGEKLFG